jgi:hypothetical protein
VNPTVIWHFQQGVFVMIRISNVRKGSAISILKMLGTVPLYNLQSPSRPDLWTPAVDYRN